MHKLISNYFFEVVCLINGVPLFRLQTSAVARLFMWHVSKAASVNPGSVRGFQLFCSRDDDGSTHGVWQMTFRPVHFALKNFVSQPLHLFE